MFLTSGIVAVLVGLKFAVGFIIGAATSKLIYRSRQTRARTLRASLAAGVVFVLISGVVGWAGSHAAFENGRRSDVAPWGEDLRLRNAIAGNEVLLCLAASIGIAALANVRTKEAMRLSVGDRVSLSDGYNFEPCWLQGNTSYIGTVYSFIPGQNKALAAVVQLDDSIKIGADSGQTLVLELRHADAEWDETNVVHIELCDFIPEHKPWQNRRQGKWVESHAVCSLLPNPR